MNKCMTVKRIALDKGLQVTKTESSIFVQVFLEDFSALRIWILNDGIVRMRHSFDGKFSQNSYSLVLTAWDDKMDSVMKKYRKKIEPLMPNIKENEQFYQFATKQLKFTIHKDPYGIQVHNLDGELLYKDLRGRTYKKDLQGRIYHYQEININEEHFYGFGQNTGSLCKNQCRLTQAPKDSLGYNAESTSPLYKHIPFYIKLNSKTKNAIGVFYHNTFESYIDVGCERSGYWPRYSYFCGDGGDIDLFFINGPKIQTVVERYTDLTGKTALCPKQAMGYLGSTMYYAELPKSCDKQIINFVKKCQKKNIPITNFHLSSGYTMCQKIFKRFVLTWNYTRFPNPKEFITEMRSLGVGVSPNVKPGILLQHPKYEEFSQNQAFVKDSQGKKNYVDRWWGGNGSFIDFTNPKARQIWKKYLKEELLNYGIRSIWNDNNEYQSLDDKGAVCCREGFGGIIDELKPIQSLMMNHIAFQACEEVYPDQRPYIITRSGFAGLQRYASTWSGDNFTSWKTLKPNVSTVLNMGLSGVANYGCDIGGFWGPSPSGQLFVRWVQNGIFQPRFSIHSCNRDNTVTEPWMYPQFTNHISEAIRFRQKLLPYIYSLLHISSIKGVPIMRPLLYEFQNDIKTYQQYQTFMLGPYLLVSTILDPLEQYQQKKKQKKIYLPKGSSWYRWGNCRQKYQGGTTIVEKNIGLHTIPIFIRSRAIIPLQDQQKQNLNFIITYDEIQQSSDKKTKQIKQIGEEFTFYDDDGLSKGKHFIKYNVKTISEDKQMLLIKFEVQKAGKLQEKPITIQVKSTDRSPFWISIKQTDNKLAQYLNRQDFQESETLHKWYYDHTKGSTIISVGKLENSIDLLICKSTMILFAKQYEKKKQK